MYNKISVSAEFIFHDSENLPEVAWDVAFLVQISTCTDRPATILLPVHLFAVVLLGFLKFLLIKISTEEQARRVKYHHREVYNQLLYRGSRAFISNIFDRNESVTIN